jgi:kynurenine formamidase
MHLIDLTRTFHTSMPVFPGDMPPAWRQVAFIERDGYNVSQLHTGMHVGTHIDAPLHMVGGGKPLSEIPLAHFIGPGCLIDARGRNPIDGDLLEGVDIPAGAILLVYTGWGQHFGADSYYRDYPELTRAFAERAIAAGVKIIGMDSPSPDRAPYLIHKALLSHTVLIMENLTNMQALPTGKPFEVIALPVPFEADGAPLRVIARYQ